MASKTLIGGTSYTVSGGKTLVGGTAYSISKGKTLVDGTGYDISFATIPTWQEIWDDATIIRTAGRNSGSQSGVDIATRYASNGDYLLSFCNGNIGVQRYDSESASLASIYFSSSSYCHSYTNGSALIYSHDGTMKKQSVYGATLALIRFSSLSSDVVDAVFSNLSVVTSAGRNTSSASGVSISASGTTNGMVISACNAGFGVYFPPIGTGTTSIAPYKNGSTSSSSMYGWLYYNSAWKTYNVSSQGTSGSTSSCYGATIIHFSI